MKTQWLQFTQNENKKKRSFVTQEFPSFSCVSTNEVETIKVVFTEDDVAKGEQIVLSERIAWDINMKKICTNKNIP